jgi:DNA polymerase-3 subunit gamma/tau
MNAAPKTAAPAPQIAEAPVQQVAAPATATLTDTDLIRVWSEFAGTLQQEDKAMSMRMRRMTPQVTGPDSFTVTVSNEQVKTYLLQISSRLIRYLRRSLLMTNLKMDINVASFETVQQSISKKEIYQNYLNKNHSLKSLVDEFKLIVE